jgi:hypothetical protein
MLIIGQSALPQASRSMPSPSTSACRCSVWETLLGQRPPRWLRVRSWRGGARLVGEGPAPRRRRGGAPQAPLIRLTPRDATRLPAAMERHPAPLLASPTALRAHHTPGLRPAHDLASHAAERPAGARGRLHGPAPQSWAREARPGSPPGGRGRGPGPWGASRPTRMRPAGPGERESRRQGGPAQGGARPQARCWLGRGGSGQPSAVPGPGGQGRPGILRLPGKHAGGMRR